MTTNELISELTEVVRKNPEKGELQIYLYTFGDSESPEPISMVDDTISDRVDINGTN